METEPEEALAALAQWPLRRARPAGSLPGSARNLNLLVQDADGSRYVLRRCRRNPRRDRILFQLEFQDHLRRHGIPTAEVIRTGTGERCVASGQAWWVLSRFVPGTPYRYGSAVQLLSAARCLSGLHASGNGFTAPPAADDTIPDLRRWWTHGDQELAALRDMFAGSGTGPELDFLGRWHDCLVRDLPLGLVDGLPRAWIHADFHGQNIVYDDDQVCGVFDFVVATQARTVPRYRVRAREGADPAQVLRGHVARMRALSANLPALG